MSKILSDKERSAFQAIAGSVMYLTQATRCGIVRGAYGSCKTPTTIFFRHLRPRYHLQPRRFRVDGFSQMRTGATIRTTAALTVKEALFCANVMRGTGQALRLRSCLYIDNTSNLHVTGAAISSSLLRHSRSEYRLAVDLGSYLVLACRGGCAQLSS